MHGRQARPGSRSAKGVFALRDGASFGTGEASTLAEMSDAWLVGRSRELVALSQGGAEVERQLGLLNEMDRLTKEARYRGEPQLIGNMLRSSAIVHLVSDGMADQADPLLDELLVHAKRNNYLPMRADAHGLRARRLMLLGEDDAALTETAVALALLDEEPPPELPPKLFRNWQRDLYNALSTIGLVLTQLGVYEIADAVMARSHHYIRDIGGPHEIAVHLINRTRLLIGWGLRLERVANYTDATERFSVASSIAEAAEAPFRQSLFPRRPDLPAADQVAVLGAAHALADPGARHLDRLRALLDIAHYPREIIVVAVSLARCLEYERRAEEAMQLLSDARGRLHEVKSEPTLQLSLAREIARLSGPAGARTMGALEHYAAELEVELWELREARVTALNARREHERLSRKQNVITEQALQDPLTGLPNRRALDEQLKKLSDSRDAHPLSIALIDLDRFKNVNDRLSHAEGDEVLRTIAVTVRDGLRGDDLVCRYGGDEFVVLLPVTPLNSAEAALARTADAVARLPEALTEGVTLSVGVVTLRVQETATEALTRADTAMYLAKRRGGNRVVAVTGTEEAGDAPAIPAPAPPDPISGPAWVLPS